MAEEKIFAGHQEIIFAKGEKELDIWVKGDKIQVIVNMEEHEGGLAYDWRLKDEESQSIYNALEEEEQEEISEVIGYYKNF